MNIIVTIISIIIIGMTSVDYYRLIISQTVRKVAVERKVLSWGGAGGWGEFVRKGDDNSHEEFW